MKSDVPDMDYPMEFEMRSLFNNLINSITVIDGDHIKFNVKDQKTYTGILLQSIRT